MVIKIENNFVAIYYVNDSREWILSMVISKGALEDQPFFLETLSTQAKHRKVIWSSVCNFPEVWDGVNRGTLQ